MFSSKFRRVEIVENGFLLRYPKSGLCTVNFDEMVAKLRKTLLCVIIWEIFNWANIYGRYFYVSEVGIRVDARGPPVPTGRVQTQKAIIRLSSLLRDEDINKFILAYVRITA